MKTINPLSSQAVGQGALMNPPETLTLTLSQCFGAVIDVAKFENSRTLRVYRFSLMNHWLHAQAFAAHSQID